MLAMGGVKIYSYGFTARIRMTCEEALHWSPPKKSPVLEDLGSENPAQETRGRQSPAQEAPNSHKSPESNP